MSAQAIFGVLLLTVEGAAPLPPQVVAGCAALYGTGPNGEWCLRRAAESAAERRETLTNHQAAAAAAAKPLQEAIARQDAESDRAEKARAELEEADLARRAVADEETRRRVAAVEEAQRTPEALQFSLSAQICDRQADKAAAYAAIKKERLYSRIGGVIHLRRLGDLQDDIESADEDIAGYRAEIHELRKRVLSCKHVAAHRE